jgi:L-fuconolactonase
MIIDSHQHFWKPARADYGWLTPELETLYHDFLPADLQPLLEKCGVEKTILVQAAPTEAETGFMLELARENEFIAGVVGWTDFESPDVNSNIARLAEDPLLVGLRPMVQDLPDDNWLALPSLAPAFEAMIEHDLVFDALLLPRHIKRLFPVLEHHPDLRVVVDHAAKPTLKTGVTKDWFDDIAAVAKHADVRCKLSGLVTEARPDWTAGDLVPVVDHLLLHFGADRIIWGSDWPVLTLAGSYEKWWKTAQSLVSTLPESDRAAIFGGNAANLYLTKRGRKP